MVVFSNMVRVKICGITNLEDALYAVQSGADALGFVFYKKSPRYIRPRDAKKIIEKLPGFVKKVGVFVNTSQTTVRKIAQDLKLDMLQFHGNESENFCKRFTDFKVIKTFRVKDKNSLKDVDKYDVWAYLFDSYSPQKFGGTGERFNWRVLEDTKKLRKIIFLSGGLSPSNVAKAVEVFSPDWVDASSCLEKYPGKKDSLKVKRFIYKSKGS